MSHEIAIAILEEAAALREKQAKELLALAADNTLEKLLSAARSAACTRAAAEIRRAIECLGKQNVSASKIGET
jgi:acyl-CoA reductase-like NAD-dependent aldehyde dehydrogenase